MNETFSFKRFGTYFKYDITRLWRKHSRAVLLMGLSGVILYVVWVFFGLLFNQTYCGPALGARYAVFAIVALVLELYMTRFYGFITDKKDGSDWILIPASKAEKFVSMLINTLIVIPVAFLVVSLGTDWLICLLDKTVGDPMISGVSTLLTNMKFDEEDMEIMAEMMVSPASFVAMTIVGGFANYLYFLLCGICFKKNKIFYAILILFGISTILSTVGAVIIPGLDLSNIDNMDEESVKALVRGFMITMYIATTVLACGLGWGVWHRISTIKH
ncbi:MAG: hypothetical protein K6A64_08845 [Bacteroidales bacterium]|nr:hypothetical protein [Bacteroidales bacterium]